MKKLGILLLIIIVIAAGSIFFAYNYYQTGITKVIGKDLNFEIAAGSSTDSIITTLKTAGAEGIDDNVFRLYLRQEGAGADLKAGKYNLTGEFTIETIVAKLREGTVSKGVKVTLPEGIKAEVAIERISSEFERTGGQPRVDGLTSLIKSTDTNWLSEEIQTFLQERKPADKPLEGFLYPDTYEFFLDASDESIVSALVENFMKKTKDLPLNSSGRTFYQNLILASIVDKESLGAADRPLVASVFNNRLKIGMLLQSDATVNYATGASNPRPTFQELQVNSPYNTYKFVGLPPTPINSPRLGSIQAAMTPEDTDYYYFLHQQDGTGQIRLGKTLAEHNQNIRKYLD
jgi:UPF0755 protein